MKYLKKYNQLNEGLRDKMSPKSDDDIIKYLNTLSKEELNELFIKSAYISNEEMIRLTLEAGADVNYVNDKYDYKNALMLALDSASVIKGYFSTVKLLLKHGANPEQYDKYGDNANDKLLNIYMDYRYQTNFNELLDLFGVDNYLKKTNEGLRDKMSPKPDEEIEQNLQKLSLESLKNKFLDLWIDDNYFDSYDHLSSLHGLLYFIEQTLNRDYQTYLLDLYVGEKDLDNILGDIGYDDVLVEKLKLNKEDFIKLILLIFNKGKQLNEGLRDKMVGKSDEEIEQNLKKLSVGKLLNVFFKFWTLYVERVGYKNSFKAFFQFIKELTGRDLWEETVKLYIDDYGYDYAPDLEFIIRYDETEESILQRANFSSLELYDITKELIRKYKELK